jgi:integrase
MSAYKDEKQGTWYVSFRYVDWTGEKKQKLKRGFRTKREALEYEAEFKRKASADMDMELGTFVGIYFEDKKKELEPNSIRNKKQMIQKHILPYFENRKMNEVLPADIIQWQNIIQEKGLKDTYERMIQNQVNALFNHAQKIYSLQNNPCKKVRRMGKADADKMSFWTKEEYDKFLSVIEPGTDNHLMAELLFWTGMREGEMLALMLKDIDLENGLIMISKTYYRSEGKDIITTPKTDTSIRTIMIPEFLIEEIKAYVGQMYMFPQDERLFPIVARTLQKRMSRFMEKAGVKRIRIHDFRHSHVAYLINQGVQPLIIKERLGHKDIKITLNTYGHLYPSQQKQVAEMLNLQRQNKSPNGGNR